MFGGQENFTQSKKRIESTYSFVRSTFLDVIDVTLISLMSANRRDIGITDQTEAMTDFRSAKKKSSLGLKETDKSMTIFLPKEIRVMENLEIVL